MWAMAFLEDLKNNLDAINEIAKPTKEQTKFTERIFYAIHYHSRIIELSVVP